MAKEFWNVATGPPDDGDFASASKQALIFIDPGAEIGDQGCGLPSDCLALAEDAADDDHGDQGKATGTECDGERSGTQIRTDSRRLSKGGRCEDGRD